MGVLITPQRFNQQPQGVARLSAYARSLGFTQGWNWGEGGVVPQDFVAQRANLANPTGVIAVNSVGGRAAAFNGVVNSRIEVAGNPFATSTCTYLWIESGIDATGSGQALTNSCYGNVPGNEIGSFQVRLGGADILILKAQTALLLTATGARNNAGKVNVGAVSSAGNSGRLAVFSNGKLAATGTGASSYTHGTSVIGGGSDCPIGTVLPYVLLFAPRAIPDDALRVLTERPYDLIFEAPPRRFWGIAVAGSGSTGTVATTNANDTSAASGTTTVTGTLARTNANDTSSASGTTTLVGTLACTNANDTATASGTVGGGSAVSGTSATTNANDAGAASGTTTVRGTVAYTNASDTGVASGIAGSVSGSAAITNADDYAEGFGTGAPGAGQGHGFEMVDLEPTWKRAVRLRAERKQKIAVDLDRKKRKRAEFIEKLAAKEALSQHSEAQIKARISSLLDEWVELAPKLDLKPVAEVPQDEAYRAFMDRVAKQIQRLEDEDDEHAAEMLLLL